MLGLDFPRSLHIGNAFFEFFRLSNQFIDKTINAVRQQFDHLKSLFIGFGKVNDVSVNGFISCKATGIKDRSLKFVDVEFRNFIGKFVASWTEMVNQSLCRYTKHGTRCSWRSVVDSLSFVKDFCDVLWHIGMSFNPFGFRKFQFVFNPKSDFSTVGTLTDTKIELFIKPREIFNSNQVISVIGIAEVINMLISKNFSKHGKQGVLAMNSATWAFMSN